MSASGKTHQELFEGLCKVLADNSQPLSEGQTKAVSGFIDVLVESVNRNWGSTVKDFIEQQKIASENKTRLALEKKDKVWEGRVRKIVGKLKRSSESSSVKSGSGSSEVMEAIKSLKAEMECLKKGEVEKVKEEFDEFRNKSALATAEAVKVERQKVESLQKECDRKDAELAEAGDRIAKLEAALKDEQLKNYLESRISGLPAFEATLMRKRFSSAKNRDEIDTDFDKVLSSVRERRSVVSTTMPRRDGVLEVQPSRLSETAKTKTKVNLLTEKNPPPTIVDPDMMEDEDFSYIDSEEGAISQSDMATWINALG